MDTMKITIITIVYNDIDNIEATITNVLSQQYDNVEYIIVDGGSTDGTQDVVKGYKKRGAIVVSESDDGIYDAMNKGAGLATGEYVLFMNSGDSFYSDDVIARFVASDPHEDVVFGNSNLLRPDGRETLCKGDMANILKKMPFNHQACFVRTNVQNKLQFDPTFKIAADYDFILRVFKQEYSFRSVDFVVSNHHLDGISNTDRFRSSIEGLHALLNYDTNNTLDLSRTAFFAKHVVDRLLHIDNSRLLEVFIGSVIDCRTTVFLSNPFKKIRFFSVMVFVFLRLYLRM